MSPPLADIYANWTSLDRYILMYKRINELIDHVRIYLSLSSIENISIEK